MFLEMLHSIRNTVSDADILESIGLLKSGLYSGDDGIPAFLIKDCKYLLLPPLRVLFNLG
jgi:hypothetical protein